ncbi:pyridoxal phosphate-dependent transferase [Cantharellus anzutake]|uniref:pyridoxal phosphate-dependent transferase n=1 Tax=Cantharellus anzutake TaxID=1750568 RepID=UPI001906176F|nr:pyridoxal phosphate-dependent transferase [Cantharellus anzutake]KAF8332076.1 pyridoxal phosphate-dependent transferase [Cantharellus anzutake]
MAPASSPPRAFALSDKVKDEVHKQDVWTVFSPASGYVPEDSINLGQGFMNWAPPEYIQEAAKKSIEAIETNHYSIPKGRIRLRQAISKHYCEWISISFGLSSPSFKRTINPDTEIVVTSGANEGIYAFELAFLRDGDEVILFEPFFDQYICNTTFNGGVPVYVPLHPPAHSKHTSVKASEWKIDFDEVRAAITPKTKAIFVNTPHNPIGKVFDTEELLKIGKIAEEFNLIILADEVYDALVFNKEHIRIAALGNLWERTITIGSAGKSFSATGWRVGWAIGPQHLVQPTLAATTRIVFCTNSPLQEAVAVGLEKAPEHKFFEQQTAEYLERRKVFTAALDKVGLPYTMPDGSYFVLVDNSSIQIPDDFVIPDIVNQGRPRDWIVSWFIVQTAGVVCIPPSDFYSPKHIPIGEQFSRFAFCKDIDTIRAAGERLLALKPYIKK